MDLQYIKSCDKILVSTGVYKFQFENKNFFVKWIENSKEYTISKKLESLGLDTFAKSEYLFREPRQTQFPLFPTRKHNKYNYYMVMNEIPGEDLDKVIPKLTDEEFRTVIQKIVDALVMGWEKLKFTHGDLHLKNILVFGTDPTIFDYGYASFDHPNRNLNIELWNFFTNLALNTKDFKKEIVFQFVETYFKSRSEFQESFYATFPGF